MLKRLFISASIFAGAMISSATTGTIYLAQTAAGDGSGSSTGNRMALATINSSWTLNPGDTLSLGGTFTNALNIRGSGTAGNPITILFEPNAKFSAPTMTGAWI